MHPLGAALDARDLDAALALLDENVTFRSPVVFTPYQGRAAVGSILSAVLRVFEDFRYVREIGSPDAPDHALVFEAHVGDKRIEGCDFLHTGANGLIDEFVVMVRPMSGMHALAEAMRAELAADSGHAG